MEQIYYRLGRLHGNMRFVMKNKWTIIYNNLLYKLWQSIYQHKKRKRFSFIQLKIPQYLTEEVKKSDSTKCVKTKLGIFKTSCRLKEEIILSLISFSVIVDKTAEDERTEQQTWKHQCLQTMSGGSTYGRNLMKKTFTSNTQ